MDLKQAFKATIEAFDKKEQDLARDKELLDIKASQLALNEKELIQANKDLEEAQRSVRDVKDVQAQREANKERSQGLDGREALIRQKEHDLKKYENQLFEIKSRQDEVDQQLRARETEVSNREKTYREEIEKSFASNLAKNLLNK